MVEEYVMKILCRSFILLTIIVLGFPSQMYAQQNEENQAEQIIISYMEVQEINIELYTDEYARFMKGILLGEHPELTGEESEFIKSEEELNNLIEYATQNLDLSDFQQYSEPKAQEVSPLLTENEIQSQTASGFRASAIAYAYLWSTQGAASRNSDYPDFEDDDCTNFVSQAMKAGGFREIGSGDGCKHEETNVEWYVEANDSPPLTCLGNFRNWEWSTTWSATWPFRDYFAYQNNFAVELGWTTSHTTTKDVLSPGDVIQLQAKDDMDVWLTYHTMIATMEDADEIYVTYHSNGEGLDEVDKPLSSILTSDSHRYMLVKINFPYGIYLPTVTRE